MTIRNVFFKDYLVKNDFQTFRLPLQLFWFSQKIGKGRGLENVFRSLAQFKENEVQLNLLGSITSVDKSYFESIRNELGLAEHRVIYLAPVAESQLTAIAGKFHIGLACEPGRDMNNELALSNKIFIYMLGGLAILASNTQSQTEFLNRYVGVGKPFVKESPESLSGQIQFFLENPDELMRARINARNLALSELNWEEEQKLFLNNVLSVLESA
jgi:glycosyltransferase involved in cell wall biosynthesis